MSQSMQFRARFGTPKMVDEMQHSDDADARAAVAEKHPDRHAQMLDDSDEYVRAEIARHGNKAHLDHLMKAPDIHSSDWLLGSNIARNGHPEHLDKLVNHPSELVRQAVSNHGLDRHHDVLMHDQSYHVRSSVAVNGNDNHRRALMNDPHSEVRSSVARHTHDPAIMAHLANDKDQSVRWTAQNRPKQIEASKLRMKSFLDQHGNDELLR